MFSISYGWGNKQVHVYSIKKNSIGQGKSGMKSMSKTSRYK